MKIKLLLVLVFMCVLSATTGKATHCYICPDCATVKDEQKKECVVDDWEPPAPSTSEGPPPTSSEGSPPTSSEGSPSSSSEGSPPTSSEGSPSSSSEGSPSSSSEGSPPTSSESTPPSSSESTLPSSSVTAPPSSSESTPPSSSESSTPPSSSESTPPSSSESTPPSSSESTPPSSSESTLPSSPTTMTKDARSEDSPSQRNPRSLLRQKFLRIQKADEWFCYKETDKNGKINRGCTKRKCEDVEKPNELQKCNICNDKDNCNLGTNVQSWTFTCLLVICVVKFIL